MLVLDKDRLVGIVTPTDVAPAIEVSNLGGGADASIDLRPERPPIEEHLRS